MVLHTFHTKTNHVSAAFNGCLDSLAEDEQRHPDRLLFDSS
jgi:hypothetical protein